MRTFILVFLLTGCGETAGMSGPTVSGKLEDSSEEASSIQSNDILARDPTAKKVGVMHVLIGWKELGKNYDAKQDPRAAARSREDADKLAVDVLKRCNAGDDIGKMMEQYSEDAGSAKNGRVYDVTTDAKLVFEFKRLSLRLNPNECGLVQTMYGWHIIKRVE